MVTADLPSSLESEDPHQQPAALRRNGSYRTVCDDANTHKKKRMRTITESIRRHAQPPDVYFYNASKNNDGWWAAEEAQRTIAAMHSGLSRTLL